MEILLGASVLVIAVFLALASRFQRIAYAKQVAEQQAIQKKYLALEETSSTQLREIVVEITAIRKLLEKKA